MKVGVVAVGDEADALGEERIVDFDLFQADRALLARDLGETGDLVDQFALRHAAHREGELRAERQAVEDRRQRKADQGRRERAAENHDGGVLGDEHVQVAAHQDHEADDDDAGRRKPETGRDIHDTTPPTHTTAARPDGAPAEP